jgi:hypothetical protein
MGLEPTTFCMARNRREPSASDSSRQTARLRDPALFRTASNRQQLTREADWKADCADSRRDPGSLRASEHVGDDA